MTANGATALIEQYLPDWQAGWSLGAFGALAEFHQDQDEALVIDEPQNLIRATKRGAIRFNPDNAAALRPIAYETLSPKPRRWSHAVAFCLPGELATCEQRFVLTELGPDIDAILPANRADILFDMGLSLLNCDFCIRTSDPELLSVLRAHKGRSLFEPDNPAMGVILASHPHRVAITTAGRAEVFQKIGGPDTGGVSPAGPHTHVLPKLMASGRTHTANTPIPEGWVPVACLHPGNPVIGPLGEDRRFDPMLHDQFQKLLQRFGRSSINEVKKSVEIALYDGQEPDGFFKPDGRHERAALRIALRQHHRLAAHSGDQLLVSRLKGWRNIHDGTRVGEDADDEAPGHEN